MKYCINPLCEARENPDNAEKCLACGTSLVINGRIRLIKPLRELTEEPYVRIEVFEVDDSGTKWDTVRRRRIMKVLKWGNSKFVELFEQESRTLRRLNHPCIPGSTIDDFFTFVPNNSPLTLRCIVMDKIEGQNLQKWIQSNGRISESLAVKWLKHLVEILDLVHHTEFFHRDIKPANIILQPDGRLALVDFGAARRITDTYLAKVSASGGTSTRMGNYEITAIVSPGYTPLEQINGKAVPQSDFYALGRTFVYLITAIPLVKLPTDENTGQLIWRNKAPQIGKRFADLIDEMMAPFPGQRPQTNEIILHRLKKLPSQTNFDKFVKSKTFIFIVIGLVSFTGLGMFNILLPVIANYFVSQGKNLETKKQSETAQKFFNWAIKINPRTNQTISSFYFEKAGRNFRNLQLAKTYYEKASQYNPQDVDVYRNLALVCQYLNQFECVINNYAKALKIRDKDWELHYELGNFYVQANKYDLAEKQYKIAIKLNKEAAAPINNLSRLKNREGNYHESEALARQGLNLTEKPEIKTTLYKNLGWAKLGQQQYIEANKYLQKSMEIDSTKIDTYCLLAQVQDAVDETTNARISWEVCMIAESSLPEVLIWRQQLLDRLRGCFKRGGLL